MRLRCPDDVSGDIGGCSARREFCKEFVTGHSLQGLVRVQPGKLLGLRNNNVRA